MVSASDDLTQISAVDLAGHLKAGDITSVELTEQVLRRIEALNPIVGAFITVTADLAMDEAAAADRRRARGESLSAIDGIPYSLKDLEETAGIRTTKGSKFLEIYVPTRDSGVSRILRSSGGVLLGKTNTPHMGYKDMCDNFVAPTTVNPWDTSKTPGGSSGGAAAAVAAGLGPIHQGGDGAGSIRIPAGLTGVVGFKGTFGRVPVTPQANAWTHRVHNGPLARTVADAAMFFEVMAQVDDRDPLSVHLPMPPFHALVGARPLAGTKALFLVDFGYGMVTPEVEANTRSAVSALRALGCDVVEADTAPWFNPAGFHSMMYAGGGFPKAFEAHREWVEEDFTFLLERGGQRTVAEVVQAEADRSAFHQEVLEAMTDYDFIVSPTMPLPAWSAVPGPGPTEINGVAIDPALSRAFLVYPFNLTGQPAISIPSGFTTDGLPTGVQIVGRKYADLEVLQAADALEHELDLQRVWPTPEFRPAGLDARVKAS